MAYQVLAACEDDETQKSGLVVVAYFVEVLQKLDPDMMRRASAMFDWFPVRVTGLHFCVNNPILFRGISVFAASLNTSSRARIRAFSGKWNRPHRRVIQ